MDEAYWRQLVDIKIAEQYFLLYARRSGRQVWAVNALCLIMSGTGIVGWFTENISPLHSSLIILAAQIICILQPIYPFSDRYFASNCICKEYEQQALIAEQKMNRILYGAYNTDELLKMLEELQNSTSVIEDKFAAPSLFPPSTLLHKKAQKNAAEYLNAHFHLGGTP